MPIRSSRSWGADLPNHYFRNTAKVQELAAKHRIEIVPAIFNIGYSNSMLWHDTNLIEAMPVKEAPLIVKDGVAQITNDVTPLPGSDFSDLRKWTWKTRMSSQKTARRALRILPRSLRASFRIKTSDGKTLNEGTDFERLRDPVLGAKP